MEEKQQKLGLLGLITIVIGGVIGGGIFNIAKVLAHDASLGAITISWVISGIGLLAIALTFKTLNTARPELSTGIYMYTRSGFGNYAGFNIAWGYWIGTAIGNVVLSVMLNDAFGLFFPKLLEHGWPTVIFASCFNWLFTLIVSYGLKFASAINTISTIIKFTSLLTIIIFLFSFANYDMLKFDFWGRQNNLGPLSHQINSTMLTTLFFFMGIEGAVVVASRARLAADVGKATVIGYLICLVLNISVCILSFGFVHQAQLGQLNDPSVGQILGKGVGDWARIFVNVSVIISVAGAWLVSTILAAELAAGGARDKVLPHFFVRRNHRGAPISALLITAVFIQLFLFLVVRVHHFYLLSVNISGIMILPTYIFSAIYLVKSALKKKIDAGHPYARQTAIITGTVAALYCLWVIYAGNIHLLLLSSTAYVVGIVFYRLTRRQDQEKQTTGKIFSVTERYLIGLMVAAMVFSILLEWYPQLLK